MNKIYRLIWSAVQNTFVVAAEMAKSRGKSGKTTRAKSGESRMGRNAGVLVLVFGVSGGAWAADCAPNPLSISIDRCQVRGGTFVIDSTGVAAAVNILGSGGSIENSGQITGPYTAAIYGYGNVTSILNRGLISSGGWAIDSSYFYGGSLPSIGTLTNVGTINGTSYLRQVTALNNLQGASASNPLLIEQQSFRSSPIANYNLIANSLSDYGQVSFTGFAGSFAFNVYGNTGTTLINGIAASTLAAGTYSNVLQGISSPSAITGTSGSYGSLYYRLVQNSLVASNWDLQVQATPFSTNILAPNTYSSAKLGTDVNPVFQGGTLQVAAAGSIADNFTVDSSNGTIDQKGVNSNFTGVISNASTGGGKMIITNSGTAGTGKVVFSGTNTYSGGTEVDSGAVLSIGSASALGSGGLALVGNATTTATLATTANMTLSAPITVAYDPTFSVASGTTLTVSSSIADGTAPGDIVAAGGGTLALTAANTYTGATTINSGSTLALSGNGSVAASSGVTDNGTLDISATTSGASIKTLSGSGGVVTAAGKNLTLTQASGSYSGDLSGAGGLTVAAGTETLTGINSYTGDTTIANGATLALSGNSNAIMSSSRVVDNGTLDISAGGLIAYVNSLSGSGSVVTGSGGGLRLVSASDTFSGVISGSGDLRLLSGTQTLAGANTFTGGTTVDGGNLVLSKSGTSGSGSLVNNASAVITVNNGGTLTFAANDLFGIHNVNVVTPITINSGGTVTNNGTFVSKLGPLTLNGGRLTSTGGLNTTQGPVAWMLGGTVTATGSSTSTISGTGKVMLGSGAQTGTTFNVTGTKLLVSANLINGGTTAAWGVQQPSYLTKQGTGTLTLSGANTYAGTTTVSAGTLQAGAANSLSSGSAVTVASGATLDLNGYNQTIASLAGAGNTTLGAGTLTTGSGGSTTYSGNLRGSGDVVKAGSSTWTLSGTNSNLGNVTVSGGTLALNSTSALNSANILNLASGTTVNFANSGTTYIGALFNNGGSVNGGSYVATLTTTQSGVLNSVMADGSGYQAGIYKYSDGTANGGTTTIGAANTFTGVVKVVGGTLQLDTNGSFAAASSLYTAGSGADQGVMDLNNHNQTFSAINGTGGQIALGSGTLTVNGTANSDYSGVINGTGGMTKAGSGTVTLHGSNTYTGATNISGGTLALSGNGSIASSSGVVDDGTLDISATTSGASITTLSGSGNVVTGAARSLTLTNAAGSFGGNISGAGGLTVSTGTETLTGANAYTGATTIASGVTLALSGSGSIADSSGVADNGTFNISATTSGASIKSLSGNGSVALGAKNLTLTAAADTFAGAMNGTGGLAVTGGTETLTGVNTYTGSTSISSGATVALSGNGSLAASSSVADNGTLDISATTNGASIRSLSGASSGSVALGAKNLTLTNAADTFAGAMNGTGGVVVTGGTETLSGVNTYTGATTIASGATIALSGSGSVAASSGVADNGTFDISATTSGASIKTLSGSGSVVTDVGKNLTLSNAAGSFGGNISGAGGLTVSAGTETLTGANAYTGATTIANGAAIALSGSGSIAASSGVADNGTLDISATSNGATIKTLSGNGNVALGAKNLTLNAAADTFAGAVSGTGGLAVTGGTETLTGAHTYTGATAISSGATLALSGSGSIADSSSVADNGTLDISATTSGASIKSLSGASTGSVTLGAKNLTLTAAADTFAGAIGGTGGLAVTAGTETLSGANTYTGATAISSGATLALSGSGSVAASSGVTDNGTLDISGTTNGASITSLSGSSSGSVVLGAKTLTLSNALGDFAGVIGGTGDLTLSGGLQKLSGANTYTGATTVSGGILRAGAANAFSSGSAVTVASAGRLDLYNYNQTIASLAGAGNTTLGSGSLTTGGNNASTAYSGNISGSGDVTKVGSGTWTLSGTNSNLGNVTINGGTLALNSTSAVNSNNILNLTSGTTVNFATSGTTYIGAMFNNGGTVNGGSYVATLTTTSSGALNSVLADGSGFAAGIYKYSDGSATGGTTTVSAANTFTGVVKVVGGELKLVPGGSFAAASTLYTSGTGAGQGVMNLNDHNQTFSAINGMGGQIALGSGTLTVNGTADSDYYGSITGTGHVSKSGSGTVTLYGVNTYTGTTSLSAGTLALSGAGTLGGASASTAVSGGTLDLGGTTQVQDGGVTLTGGTVQNGTLRSAGTFDLQSGQVDAALDGDGSVQKTTSGTVTLTGTNTYTGFTSITNGTLNLTGSLASPMVTVAGGTLNDTNGGLDSWTGLTVYSGNANINADQTIGSLNGSGGNVTVASTKTLTVGGGGSYAGVVSGAGGLTVAGGTQTLSGANTYTGATTLNSGSSLQAGAANAFSSASAVSVASGALLNLNNYNQTIASLAGAGSTTLGAGSLTTGDGTSITYNGNISGSGNIVKNGSGTWTLGGTNSALGNFTVNDGTVTLTSNSALNSATVLNLANGTAFNFANTGTTYIGALFNNGGHVNLGTYVATLTTTQSGTLNSVLANGAGFAAGIYKYTGGTTTIGAANTFTGVVKVEGGTLQLATGGSFNSASSLYTSGSGVMDLNNHGQTFSAINGSGGQISMAAGTLGVSGSANSDYYGSITGTGVLDKSGSGTVTLYGANTYAGATNITGGMLALSGSGSLASTAVLVDGGTLNDANGGLATGTHLTVNSGGADINADQTIADLNGSGGSVVLGSLKTLTVNGSGSYAGTLAGAGKFAINGGTMTLSGTNTHAGGIEVAAGATLNINSGAALGSGTLALVGNSTTPANLAVTQSTTINNSIAVTGDPVFNIASGTTTTINGVIADGASPGDVDVVGGGALNLTAANTYTGQTTVASGSTLALSGSGGIANSSTVINSGTLDLTNASSTVNLGGSYTQSGTGNLNMVAASGAFQKMVIAGAANLGGSLSLTAAAGNYRIGRYTLLSAGSLTGTFSTFSNNLASVTPLGITLGYNASSVYLDLSPDGASTQQSVQQNAQALSTVINMQVAALQAGLSYDCYKYDENNLCVSVGGRYTYAGPDPSGSAQAGLVIVGYRPTVTTRIGAFADQSANISTPGNISQSKNSPMWGVFGNWNMNKDGEGFGVQGSAAFASSELSISRSASSTSEAGQGKTQFNGQAFQVQANYTHPLTDATKLVPYLGLRYTRINQGAYSENSNDQVLYPLSYNAMAQNTFSAIGGVGVRSHLAEKLKGTLSAGIQQNLNYSMGNYAGTSNIPGVATFSSQMPNNTNTMATASSGLYYDVRKNEQIGLTALWQQQPFINTNTTSVIATYTIGF